MFIQSNELKPVYSICRYLVVNGTLFFGANIVVFFYTAQNIAILM